MTNSRRRTTRRRTTLAVALSSFAILLLGRGGPQDGTSAVLTADIGIASLMSLWTMLCTLGMHVPLFRTSPAPESLRTIVTTIACIAVLANILLVELMVGLAISPDILAARASRVCVTGCLFAISLLIGPLTLYCRTARKPNSPSSTVQ